MALRCAPDRTQPLLPLFQQVFGAGHFTVAWGRDYSDVPPVKGVALGGREQVISVSVEVAPQSAE